MIDKSSFGPGVSEIVSGKKAEAGNAKALAMQADDARTDCSKHGAEKTFVNRSRANSGSVLAGNIRQRKAWQNPSEMSARRPDPADH